MKLGIVGTRRRNTDKDYKIVEKAYLKICKTFNIHHIISGGCQKGGDRFAEIIARKFGLPITIYHADWKRYGRSAGFERNTYIAEDSTILLACVAKDRTGGTEDTIAKFKLNHTKQYVKEKLILV